MPEPKRVSKELRLRIESVQNKRARFVLDAILKNGIVTTEEISNAGYEHPPRAVRDARELGFPIKTMKVKHSNGRSIAAYVFDESMKRGTTGRGRNAIPKKRRVEIIRRAQNRCQICGSEHNLQVDHCVPFEVAGERLSGTDDAFLVLCGSCNRTKSWACEHCPNWSQRDQTVCQCCYWAGPPEFAHVATIAQFRIDLVWSGGELADCTRILESALQSNRSIQDEIKSRLRNS
jgi:5-methylcytosine-specific restriction endonuclease McrA